MFKVRMLSVIRKMTSTKSFRMEEELLRKLSVLAARYGVNENKLVTDILASRVEIDPLIPTFEGISLARETFRTILNTTNVDSLEISAWELGRAHFATARRLYESNGEQLSFLKFVSIVLGRHGRWFRIEGKVDSNSKLVTLHHELSLRWSIFLKAYLAGAFEVLSRVRLIVHINEEFVELEIPGEPKF
jgi:hypothetical protein